MIRISILAMLFFKLPAMVSAQSFLIRSPQLTGFPRAGNPAPTVYHIERGAVSACNLPGYNNRPLYCTNSTAFVLAGDKPLIRLVQAPFVYGAFMLAFLRDGKGLWLQDFDSLCFFYRAGSAEWTARDSRFPGISIQLTVIPEQGGAGMVLRAEVRGAKPGDALRWLFGGAELRMKGTTNWKHSVNLAWEFDPLGHPELSGWSFQPEACLNNTALAGKDNILLHPQMDSLGVEHFRTTVGSCSDKEKVVVTDAEHWQDPLLLKPVGHSIQAAVPKYPALMGTIRLCKTAGAGKASGTGGGPGGVSEFFWSFRTYPGDQTQGKAVLANFSPAADWQRASKAADRQARIVTVHTPDPRLDALASISGSVIDALWRDSAYVHGAMLWNIPFPGWRVLFGGAMYGWHERIRTEAHYYLSSQKQKPDFTQARADPALLLTGQATGSRFYGAGRVQKDQAFYNMQSQFFDQLISEWRHTGDTAFERLLRPALELHLQWETDCFDPDGDGLYESYMNTWPSDSQWYNGGGTAEETAYAYKGQEAAADMAERAGEKEIAERHRRILKKIRDAFFNRLWVAEKGYPGASLEQVGYRRLHEDPWLYSIFLPIDAGMEEPLQSASSLYYTQWALQNDRMPAGGRRVWTSGWVPGFWSVREMYPGDNYHLALAYFLAGFPEDGWDILKGTFLESAFNGPVPGNFGAANSGTDFGDCSHMFARALVEGLFGFRPDYPNHIVTISPQLPAAWDSARIHIADYDFRFLRSNSETRYEIGLRQPAALDLLLPVKASGVKEVRANGQPITWQWVPGFGHSLIHCRLPETKKTSITILTEGDFDLPPTMDIRKKVGDTLRLQWSDGDGAIVDRVEDPQHVLGGLRTDAHSLSATIVGNKGFHSFMVKLMAGHAPVWVVVYCQIAEMAEDLLTESSHLISLPDHASWHTLDLAKAFNGRIESIYQQQYLSPRPNTVSVRIGTDGYSPWTFPYWKEGPPTIKTDSIAALTHYTDTLTRHTNGLNRYADGLALHADSLSNSAGRIITPQGVPFAWGNGQRNIAFTSLWDNWPRSVTIPVGEKGDEVFLLIAGSTNPMQCYIANASLQFRYTDGSEDTLALVPPYNYWNVSPITKHDESGSAGQGGSRNDYTAWQDSFCVPKPWPETVQLGQNCRAMLLHHRLRPGIELKSVGLQTLSPEVVVGLMGVTILNPEKQEKR